MKSSESQDCKICFWLEEKIYFLEKELEDLHEFYIQTLKDTRRGKHVIYAPPEYGRQEDRVPIHIRQVLDNLNRSIAFYQEILKSRRKQIQLEQENPGKIFIYSEPNLLDNQESYPEKFDQYNLAKFLRQKNQSK